MKIVYILVHIYIMAILVEDKLLLYMFVDAPNVDV